MISYLEHARKDATIQLYIIDYLYIYTVYMHTYVYIYIHNKQSTDTDAIQGPVLSHLLLSTGSCPACPAERLGFPWLSAIRASMRSCQASYVDPPQGVSSDG